MNWDEYSEFVTGLASEYSMKDFNSKLLTGGLGLAGEAGEVADLVKKVVFHGKEWNEDLRQKMILEVGDLGWYLAFICKNVLNVTLQDVIDANVKKLQDRYKTGKFTVKEFTEKENLKQ